MCKYLKASIFTLTIVLLIALLFFTDPGFYILKANKSLREYSNDDKQILYNNIPIVYLISLDRSVSRRAKILPSIKELGFPYEIIHAVDGRGLSDDTIEKTTNLKKYYEYMGRFPKKGTIGCIMSHLNTWKKLLESDYAYALIIEDDVSFDPDLLRNIVKHSLNKNNLWDILSFEILHRGMPNKVEKIFDDYFITYYLINVTHAGAYLINRKTADKLFSSSYSNQITLPVDHFFTRAWEFNIKFAGIEPRIVKQTYGDSEIGNTSRYNDSKKEVEHKRWLFVMKSDIARFLYNLKLIIMHKFLPN